MSNQNPSSYDPNQPDPNQPPQSYGSAGSYGSAPEVSGAQPAEPQQRYDQGYVQGYQQPGYGQPIYAQPYGALPEHPQGTTILVLGIVGLFVTICAPIAWYMGSKAQKEIAATGVRYANEQNIKIGKILGMVLTILAIIGLAIGLAIMVIAIIAAVASN